MSNKDYSLKVTDLDWIRENIKCMAGCPVNTYAGGHYGYIGLIVQGRYEEAYQIAHYPNPFPVACGYTCGAPCQTTCRRKDFDTSVQIRDLKRFLVDTHFERFGHFEVTDRPVAPKTQGKKIAVIGAGPGGLTAALDLAEKGYEVVVFDSMPEGGGMMRYGVPSYRYPREMLKLEIDAIQKRGVEIRYNTRIGRDVMLSDLRREYAAVILAIGFNDSRMLPVPGHEASNIFGAVAVLKEQFLGNDQSDKIRGKRVIVIGGGNVAFDIARVSVRLGAASVTLTAMETYDKMPADLEEKEEGGEEGVRIINQRGPQRFEVNADGSVKGLWTKQVDSIFDKEGRFNPSFVEGSDELIEADAIMVAIGQAANLDLIKDCPDLELGPRGTPSCDLNTQMTTAEGVFLAGDIETGPKLIITAIASGHRCADQVDRWLHDGQPSVDATTYRFNLATLDNYQMPAADFEVRPFVPIPLAPLEVRKVSMVDQAHTGYTEEMAIKEAERCLWCDVNTPIDDSECILCNGCVDVCPYNTLHMVDLSMVEPDTEAAKAVEQKLGMPLAEAKAALAAQGYDFDGTLMIKDERLCVRCGLCAMRCPTGAIRMEHLLQEDTPQYAY
jgi:NADPH-dependent glutamate synthase beta subunit-like oxidoreductase